MIDNLAGITQAHGLGRYERECLEKLVAVYQDKVAGNQSKMAYYEGSVTPRNLGFALPNSMDKVRVRCGWGKKAVSAVANRSVFDSFVATDEDVQRRISAIDRRNNIGLRYRRALPGELSIGCTFGKVTKSGGSSVVRFHSALTAAGLWDGENDRILCGFAIMDSKKSDIDDTYRPSTVHLEMPDATWVLKRDGNMWTARRLPHRMGRPMMEAMVNGQDDFRPFGYGRLNGPVQTLIDEYCRGMSRLIYSSEIYTSPQKVLLGASDATFDLDKLQMYLTNILLIGKDEDGDVPTIQQMSGASMQPLIDVLQYHAKQFCNVTDVPLSEMGIVTDTPSSAESIYAQKENLITTVEFLNQSNGEALRNLGLMALAVDGNKSFDSLTDEELDIMPLFKNPAMPSIASTADAMVKIASVDPSFAGTDVFYEGMGYDAATIERIKASQRRATMRGSFMSLVESGE